MIAKRKKYASLSIILIVVCCPALLLAARSSTYKLTVMMKPETHLRVQLALDGYGDNLRWRLPMSLGKLNDLYKNVHDLQCRDVRGHKLKIFYEDKHTIDIEPTDKMVCSYVIRPDVNEFTPSTRFNPFFRRDYFYFTGKHFVISPADSSKNIDSPRVTVSVPRGWRELSTWNIGKSENKRGWSDLENAIFIFGDYRLKSIKLDEKKIYLILRGDWLLSDHEIASRLKSVVEYINGLWSNGTSDKFFFVVNQYDRVGPDGWYNGTMLGDAIAMELSYGSPFGDAYEGLVAHEYFHRWNGGIIEAGCKNEMECYWLQEGATSYLADIVVSNQYVDNIDKFLEYLGSRIEAHTNNNMKGADQSKIRRCFWNDNACYNLIYDRGYLLSWMLDYELRIRSKGNKTLIGYLRYLVELAENGAYVYDNDRLLNSINDYSTSEFRSFWKKYVLSNEALPVNDYLDKCNVVIKGSVAGEANSERSYSSSVEVSDGRPRSEKWKHRYDFDAGGVADGVTIMDILALMDSR